MKLPKIAAALFAATVLTGSAFAMEPVTIVDQGSFLAGGTVVTAPGTYKGTTEPTNNAGETLHGDHAYVFYQKPKNAHHNSMVFLHGYGQSAKTWETTPDGRDGFQNIFLEKGYKTYLVDEPRRGRAGRSTVATTISARPDDQLWFNNFRIGQWPGYYDNAAVPKDAASQDQFSKKPVTVSWLRILPAAVRAGERLWLRIMSKASSHWNRGPSPSRKEKYRLSKRRRVLSRPKGQLFPWMIS